MTVSGKKEIVIYVTKNLWSTQTYMGVFSLSEKKINWQVYNEIGHTATKSYRLSLIMEVWILKPCDLGEQTRV